MTVRRVLAAPDKFKGTATAHDIASAIGHACWEAGVDVVELPMSDGGDGLLGVLGGANRTSQVTGPLGSPVDAAWRMHGGTAVIEIAAASGLVLAGNVEGNDPLAATTAGVGELIDRALDANARRIIVGLGGSATTDGGYGAIRAMNGIARLENVELLVACDVETRFVDAARVFAPQKGATPSEVKLLTNRLQRLVQMFAEEFNVDIAELRGGGAAGGLAGALAALGGRLVPGVELVADELDLFDHLVAEPPDVVDLVITGEGALDATSFDGKVVGGLLKFADEVGVPVVAVVGSADADVVEAWSGRLEVIVLADRFGVERSRSEPKACVTEAVAARLGERS